MSGNNYRTSAAQPETGSLGFGADDMNNMFGNNSLNFDNDNNFAFANAANEFFDFDSHFGPNLLNNNTVGNNTIGDPIFGNNGFGNNMFGSRTFGNDTFVVDNIGNDTVVNNQSDIDQTGNGQTDEFNWDHFITGMGEETQEPVCEGADHLDVGIVEPSANPTTDSDQQLDAALDAELFGDDPSDDDTEESQQDNAELAAPPNAATTPLEEHFTSNGNVPVEHQDVHEYTSDGNLPVEHQDAHQYTSDFQVPSSAGQEQGQGYITCDDAMPREKQQLLIDYLNGTHQQVFDPTVSSNAGAFQNQYQFSSNAETVGNQQQYVPNNTFQGHFSFDAETLVEQPQQATNNYQMYHQNVPQDVHQHQSSFYSDLGYQPQHVTSNYQEKVHENVHQQQSSFDSGMGYQPQHVTDNYHQNIRQEVNQHKPKANLSSGTTAYQVQEQVNSDVDPPVTMSEEHLEGFRRRLAARLYGQNLSKEEQMKVIASVPKQIMDQLRRAHPMPSTQRQATAPQVPAHVPQQNGATFQQPIVPSRSQAPPARGPSAKSRKPAKQTQRPVKQTQQPALQTQRPAKQIKRSAPRSRRPAPLQGPYSDRMAGEFVDLISPTPSASSDGSLNGETYQPMIDHVQPTVDPSNFTHYPAYTGAFHTGGQASRYRTRPRIEPKDAMDTERVKNYGRQFWVQQLYTAMIDITQVIDLPNSTNLLRFKSSFWDPLDLEASAHNIFDQAIHVHERGWTMPIQYHKRTVRGKLVDKHAGCIESRLSQICEVLRSSKAVADDCIRGGITLALFVDNPQARVCTKESNNVGNNKRGLRLRMVRLIEKKQGHRLTLEQLEMVNKKYPGTERPEDREGLADSQEVQKIQAAKKNQAVVDNEVVEESESESEDDEDADESEECDESE